LFRGGEKEGKILAGQRPSEEHLLKLVRYFKSSQTQIKNSAAKKLSEKRNKNLIRCNNGTNSLTGVKLMKKEFQLVRVYAEELHQVL